MNSDPSDPPSHPDWSIVELLEAVADARDEDVMDLPPLGEYLDPEAFERFLVSTSVPTSIRIEVYGCTVELDGDGTVTVVDDGDSR